MKKYLIFLLIPVCLLWGCQKEEMGTKTYSISETEESSHAIFYYDGEKTVTEEGVLFPVEDQGGGILTYYDYVQEESYPFCSNVNCEHNDSSCSAWFDSFAEAPGIYSGQIYVFSYLNEADEWDLISMDVDGTNRKTVAKFSPEDFACDSLLTGVSASWYIDGNSVFVISCTSWEEDAMDFRAVVKVDLKNGNKEILTEIGDEDNVIGIYNDVLLISRKNPVTPLLEQEEFFETNGKQADYDAYYNEWYESSYRETYYTLNWSNGETKDLFDTIGDVPEWDYSRISSDGMFYYSLGKEISGVNLISGEMETVYEDENEITMECTADGNLFFQTLSDDRNKKVSDCYLNLETGEVKELSQNMPDGSWIYSETSKYFIGNGPINLKFNYIFIPKEDYYSSNYDAAKGIKVIE